MTKCKTTEEVSDALRDLLAQVEKFCEREGEADFYTGRARAALDLTKTSPRSGRRGRMFSKDEAARLLENAHVFYPRNEGDDEIGDHLLNMNDTWAWATAWAEKVEDDALVEVAELFWRYGNAGLLYWVSQQHDGMRSEFYDNNRAIEFVANEERIRKNVPDYNKRAYHKESYTITGNREKP